MKPKNFMRCVNLKIEKTIKNSLDYQS